MNIETPLQRKLKAVIDSRQIKVDNLNSPRHRGTSPSTPKTNKAMSGSTTKANAAELQSRLKVCINSEPSNKQCCDCNDAKPTWSSLIMVPNDAKHWSTSRTLATVVCYACAAAHRSLGTHICRVKSCNLDEWNENEVIAMELGGNAIVNKIFEATLVSFSNDDAASSASAGIKPTPRVDNTTRTNFIREKYDKRNFYDASKYADVPTLQPSYQQQRRPSASGSGSGSFFGGDEHSSMNNSSMMHSKASLMSGSVESNGIMMPSPRRSSQQRVGSNGQLNKVLSRGSMQSARQISARSFQSNTSDGLDSIGIDRSFAPPKNNRESLTYADLFEPSDHGDASEVDIDESENDFLGLTSSKSNGSGSETPMNDNNFGSFDSDMEDVDDSDDGDVDSEDDLFADSATTATDLFGHGTNYPKKKGKNYNPSVGGAIREDTSESWDPFAAEEDGAAAPAPPAPVSPPAPPPPMFAESPAASTLSRKSTKSAPSRPNYGGKMDDLWRSPVSKTPGGTRKLGKVTIGADGTARVMGGSLRRLGGGSTRKMNSQAVMSSLDAWLTPTAAEKPKVDDLSNSPNPKSGGSASSHQRSSKNSRNRPSVRRSTSSPGGEPSPRMTSRKSARKIRSCSPPPLVDADEPDDHNQDFEAIQGEVDLFTGFQGFDQQFVVAGGDGGDSKTNSPSNKSAQSQKVTGNTLDSFFQTDDGVDATWSPKSFPGQSTAFDKARPGGSGTPRRRRDSSSGASIGSHKSSSSNNNGITPRRKSSKDLRPPLTPSGGRALRRSSAAGSSRTLSSTSTNGSTGNKSSSSPTSIMEMNNNKEHQQNEHSNSGDEDNDWAADFGDNNAFDSHPTEKRRSEHNRSSRSERRSSRTATSSSSPQRRPSSESRGSSPVVSSSVHRRSAHRRSSTRGSNAKTSRSPSRERRPRASAQRRRTSSQTSEGSPGPSSSDRRSSSRRSTSRSTSVTSSHSRPSRSPSRERRSSHHRRGSNNNGGGGGSHHHRPSRSPSRERRSSHRRGSSGNNGHSRRERSSRSPSVERRSIRSGRRKPSGNGWQSPMAGEKQEAY